MNTFPQWLNHKYAVFGVAYMPAMYLWIVSESSILALLFGIALYVGASVVYERHAEIKGWETLETTVYFRRLEATPEYKRVVAFVQPIIAASISLVVRQWKVRLAK